MLNRVQEKSYKLIQADARFIYTIAAIFSNSNAPESNYIMMLQPYIGLFAEGSEQWGRKAKINMPMFSEEEKEHYVEMRGSIKLFDMTYNELYSKLKNNLDESDKHFYDTRTLGSKIRRLYYNVGVDLQGNIFCGNTILCSLYAPSYKHGDKQYGEYVKSKSIIAGKLAVAYEGNYTNPYSVDRSLAFRHEDYHFFKKYPRKIKNYDDFLLFS